MRKWQIFIATILFLCSNVYAQKQSFCSQGYHQGNLFMLSNAQSRSISPENYTGGKGKGSMTELKDGSAGHQARELGRGWKVNPYLYVEPGETLVMGETDITQSGVINHIWLTLPENYRHYILRMYWDGCKKPSVEVPLGDFFATAAPKGFSPKGEAFGNGYEIPINSAAVAVNVRNGFNSYWQMPFRKGFKITLENLNNKRIRIFYQIDYMLKDVPENAGYFHGQFRRIKKLPKKDVYTVLDGIKGEGHYVGMYVLHGSRSPGWWGEGEVKIYLDGDKGFPTINYTGEEDYFLGSYAYEPIDHTGRNKGFTNFSTQYAGFYQVEGHRLFGQYRWHVLDPIHFKSDLKITLQSLGWQSGGRYLPLQDDLSSVAFWYQKEIFTDFPKLPKKEELDLSSHSEEFKINKK